MSFRFPMTGGVKVTGTMALMCVAVALVATAFALAPSVSAQTTYFSGSIAAGDSFEGTAWNYYTYNEAFNCACSGPQVDIWQERPNGTIVYFYQAAGDVDICHPGDYTRTACGNLENFSVSETCYRDTVNGC